MRRVLISTLLILVALQVAGCSYINRLTGSTDDTVLPGTREDAIPGKSQFPEGQDTVTTEQTGSSEPVPDTPQPPPCPEDKPDCAKSTDGTFSDPQ
jgi:hypothetical protein